jgi:hypothetical protein
MAPVRLESLTDPDGQPLRNRSGKQLYRVLSPLLFYSAELGIVITTPEGFITDLDSTPRIPLVYLLINGFGDGPAVTHDYLYSTGALSREQSDAVLKEACLATGVPGWKAHLVWMGVRVGGAGHYGPSTYEA